MLRFPSSDVYIQSPLITDSIFMNLFTYENFICNPKISMEDILKIFGNMHRAMIRMFPTEIKQDDALPSQNFPIVQSFTCVLVSFSCFWDKILNVHEF